MADITIRTPKVFSGLDADKANAPGAVGDLFVATDTGIEYFWNSNLSSWDNGHKQRIRCWGRGVVTIGVIAPAGSWELFASILYRGSNLEGLIKNVKFYSSLTGGTTVDVRLQDVTNAQTIGQLNGLSGARALYDLGALINIPTAFAELELQVYAQSGGSVVTMDSINAYYD